MYKRPARFIQIDLLSTCNAKCLHCYRQTVIGHENNHYEKNIHVNPKSFKLALQDPYFNNLEEILFCGNYGDPLASLHLIELLDDIYEIKPNLSLMFHTNGSLGPKDLWTALAARLNGKGKFVKFAIDGLKDTNHIYRRGVSWTSVMENAQNFIAAGGRAVWMFIIFDHNEHQVEEARVLSKKLGFAKFETRRNFASNYKPQYELTKEEQNEIISNLSPPTRSDYDVSVEKINSIEIQCESVQEESVYIDHDGRIWPCCYMAGWKYANDKAKRDYHIEKLESNYKTNFNSIYHYTPTEIMKHPLFSNDMKESWENADKIHYMCSYKCGKENCVKQI
jgi:MoaA/NifB/PqqE/SkfB family radical SAM enzyme